MLWEKLAEQVFISSVFFPRDIFYWLSGQYSPQNELGRVPSSFGERISEELVLILFEMFAIEFTNESIWDLGLGFSYIYEYIYGLPRWLR